VLTDDERRELCERLTAGTVDLVEQCGATVEVQLFGFGVRLVPPDGCALLAWFLVPDTDELFVSVTPTELTWDVDPAAHDAVEQVLAVMGAGVAGRVVVRTGLRSQSITATLDDGRDVESTRSRSRFPRPWRSRLPTRGPGRALDPYPAAGGPAHVRDVARPPALLTTISDDVAPFVSAAGYRMTRSFDVEGVHGILSERGGGAVFGWGTQVTRPDGTTALYIWFDGFDTDLAVMVADTWWFEWQDLAVPEAVRVKAVEVVRAALDDRLIRGPARTAWIPLSGGGRITTEPPPPLSG
jgi:hypothetical protein